MINECASKGAGRKRMGGEETSRGKSKKERGEEVGVQRGRGGEEKTGGRDKIEEKEEGREKLGTLLCYCFTAVVTTIRFIFSF